jgi:uncharacterized membrane protein
LLGAVLLFAGVSHLTTQRQAFRAQVPAWMPLGEDFVVIASGVVEIVLGVALIALLVRSLARHQVVVGLVVALFFVAVFPGNIAQWAEHKNAFGLDTDTKRLVRLFFQPLLVVWALWSTGAWAQLRRRERHHSR